MSEGWRLARKKDFLLQRAAVLAAIRRFFMSRDFLEVETPHRIPALAPESHIDAIPSDDWFLHTSPELCMKRLLAAGYPRLFQICRCFRGSENGDRHLPEFTMLEWYCAGIDYLDLMSECENLILTVARDLGRGTEIAYAGRTICLEKPWIRHTVKEAFEKHAPLSLEEALAKGSFDEIMAFEIEPRLEKGRPTFLYDYPLSLGALARRKAGDPAFAERFELYIGGLELVNAFSELTDEEEQRSRFMREEEARRSRGKRPYPMPEPFLRALPEMPESAGAALGVDRLVMLFTGAAGIRDVVAFAPEEL
jgi:lysyl-tRNA synthetase class 2